MKKLIFISAITLISLSFFSGCNEAEKTAPVSLKMMTYNTHNGIGLDTITDYQRIGELIKEISPDVVALQELDSATSRSDGRVVLEEISKAADMQAFYAPAIDFQGGKYGIGLLAKETPVSVKRHPLPGREEARTIIIAEFPEYGFACTHLSLTEADRDSSITIIKELIKEYEKPFFLAGDLNSKPESNFMKLLTRDFTPLNDLSELTFPADEPFETIDYILVREPEGYTVNVNETQVVPEPKMSDHRPVIVTVAVTKE